MRVSRGWVAYMKIAFATNRGGLDDYIAERFGRAMTFTIVDVDPSTGRVEGVRVVENPGYRAGSGAGVLAVQKLIDEGVEVVVGPSPGPNAYIALQQSGVRVYSVLGTTVREALERVLKELGSHSSV
ncbi:NifB/NifX family molybdenum-iron cluster-binding protein [Thermogladius sp. 4427co]|uniref:NifB/NifX family molybdenum-iron cluster-binding protein n=1 Tax=Thermogladius sp. 4427co TaxID=3450718 RepID=UPI003F79D1C6